MRNKYRNTDSVIKAGELILTEEPFAFVLSSKEKGFRCDNCLEKGKVLKCSGCQFVHYCGRVCQRDAWNDHKWECANLKRVSPKVIPDAARMMARIINRLSRGDGTRYRGFYTATSFRMWKDLMSHYSDLKTDKKRMDHFTSLCVVLHEFLNDISLPNTVELMGIYGRMVINSFNILDTDMNSIGTGIYLACSIVDHSCQPNAVASFDGKTISIRAIKDLTCLDWNQIRIAYIDLMKTPYERQNELLESYYFLCQCDRCLDENQHKLLHAAKCLNTSCDAPVNIPWKDNVQLYRKPPQPHGETKNTVENEHSGIENGHSDLENEHNDLESRHSDIENGHSNLENEHNDLNGVNETVEKGEELTEIVNRKDRSVISCDECGTKFNDKHVEKFVEVMEFTELHLQNMRFASVSYVDICKYCLEKQEGVLHPLNVLHAQTLDHAFDALIQFQIWESACLYAERLIPCFRVYYGDRHPLLGLLHLKYGKILLYKMDAVRALEQFKLAEKVIKIAHGERHPLYKEQLMPLLRQAMMESS